MKPLIVLAILLTLPGCIATDSLITNADRICNATTQTKADYRECLGNEYEEFKATVGAVAEEVTR